MSNCFLINHSLILTPFDFIVALHFEKEPRKICKKHERSKPKNNWFLRNVKEPLKCRREKKKGNWEGFGWTN